MPKRKKGRSVRRKSHSTRNKPVIPKISMLSDSDIGYRPQRNLSNTKEKSLWRVAISSATLIVTTVGGNILNNISPSWAFIIVLTSLSVFLSYWAWIISGRAIKWKSFRSTIVRMGLVLLLVSIVLATPTLYMHYLIPDRGSIEIPPYTPDSTRINVYYGNREKPVLYQAITIGKLKANPITSFAINGQAVFTIRLLPNREIAIDTTLFTGISDENKHIFSKPVTVSENALDWKPDGWNIHKSFTSYEIVNTNGVPVLVMEYRKFKDIELGQDQYSIIISGLFVTPWGICKVHNEESDAIYKLGDDFEQLGSLYKVDRISIRTISDLFNKERTYELIKDW